MKKISINKNLAKLTPDQFKTWFADKQKKKKFSDEEKWEDNYTSIGGKLEQQKKKTEK